MNDNTLAKVMERAAPGHLGADVVAFLISQDAALKQAHAALAAVQPAPTQAPPAPWVMLNDSELDTLWSNVPDCTYEVSYSDQRRFAKVVLAAFIEKQGAK